MTSSSDESTGSPSRAGQWIFIAIFVGLNLVMPMLFSDLFPFTSAPMFRDQPRRYCNYQVFGPDGGELPIEDFLLQRVYDGNPPGMGVGIQPPPILEQRFGDVHNQDQVVAHVQEQLKEFPELPFVEVQQEIVEGNDEGGLTTRSSRWRIAQVDAP